MTISSRFYRWFATALLLSGMSLSSVALTTNVKCTDGKAGDYECADVDLAAYVSMEDIIANTTTKYDTGANDVWGWTKGTREFAIYGLKEGHVFIEITDGNPVIKGFMRSTEPTEHNGEDYYTRFHDVKVIGDYAYMTSTSKEHGIQIFDLNRLLDYDNPMMDLTPDVTYYGTDEYKLNTPRSLVVNEDTNYIYALGWEYEVCEGGLHAIDVSNPLDPKFAGCYLRNWDNITQETKDSLDRITYDAQCVTYTGPDSNYSGKEICVTFNDFFIEIIDVTDKSDMKQIHFLDVGDYYDGDQQIRQGWLSLDQSYVVFGDYLDEGTSWRNPKKTKTMVFNIKDLTNPVYAGAHYGQKTVVDGNQYITSGIIDEKETELIYQANGNGGMQILQVIDYETAEFVEVGSFDTNLHFDDPYINNLGGVRGDEVAEGAFTVYPFFPSGLVVISTSSNSGSETGWFVQGCEKAFGLFVVKPTTIVPTVKPTDSPTISPTEDSDLTKQVAEDEDKNYLPTQCPDDLTLAHIEGVTMLPELGDAVKILSQDTSTVTVRLQNAWTSGDDTVSNIFYNYRSSLFAETCAEKQDVRAGQDYADIVLKCYKNAPFALLDIYVADNNGALEDGDNAEVPNCCHPDLPAETPVVKYKIIVKCDTLC